MKCQNLFFQDSYFGSVNIREQCEEKEHGVMCQKQAVSFATAWIGLAAQNNKNTEKKSSILQPPFPLPSVGVIMLLLHIFLLVFLLFVFFSLSGKTTRACQVSHRV